MSRNTSIVTDKRHAEYSTAEHSEIMLLYPLETIAGHPDNGKQQTSFYSPEDYAKRAKRHGRKIYPKPQPFTDGKFKR